MCRVAVHTNATMTTPAPKDLVKLMLGDRFVFVDNLVYLYTLGRGSSRDRAEFVFDWEYSCDELSRVIESFPNEKESKHIGKMLHQYQYPDDTSDLMHEASVVFSNLTLELDTKRECYHVETVLEFRIVVFAHEMQFKRVMSELTRWSLSPPDEFRDLRASEFVLSRGGPGYRDALQSFTCHCRAT